MTPRADVSMPQAWVGHDSFVHKLWTRKWYQCFSPCFKPSALFKPYLWNEMTTEQSTTHPYLHSCGRKRLYWNLRLTKSFQNQIDNDIWFRKQQLADDCIFQWHDIAVKSSLQKNIRNISHALLLSPTPMSSSAASALPGDCVAKPRPQTVSRGKAKAGNDASTLLQYSWFVSLECMGFWIMHTTHCNWAGYHKEIRFYFLLISPLTHSRFFMKWLKPGCMNDELSIHGAIKIHQVPTDGDDSDGLVLFRNDTW